MKGGVLLKLLAWGIALTLIGLPVAGVLTGRFAAHSWPIRQLQVSAEYAYVSAEQIRAAVAPKLDAGFFALDLDDVRAALLGLPWVARVDARKRWPDTLELTVYEQLPYARWGEKQLISRAGTLFTVAGADQLQGLPQLSGPDDQLADVVAFHTRCLRQFSGSGLAVTEVALSSRGAWRLTLASGTTVELGREAAEQRLGRFLDVWPRLASGSNGVPASIDLRYENGFAVRWADAAARAPAATSMQPGA
ncbi:cell division protein FtsQ/DivIB [Dokdonella koreensis]|uniref:Cell division protein FtsQ n=1 Tax=Dokdonella koreensis DS-123 TaxID=1300342 RepID=A0A167GIC9_9GAMM|nr:cell division protein FtsQ/DivIB [Dokdonella koreensis]ANB16593.1 Cell division protein FtsQ [Dokdonella koreensis DS-123]